MKSTNYDARNYSVFSSLPLYPPSLFLSICTWYWSFQIVVSNNNCGYKESIRCTQPPEFLHTGLPSLKTKLHDFCSNQKNDDRIWPVHNSLFCCARKPDLLKNTTRFAEECVILFLPIKIITGQYFQIILYNFFRYNHFILINNQFKTNVEDKIQKVPFFSSSAFKTPEGLSRVLLIYWPSV